MGKRYFYGTETKPDKLFVFRFLTKKAQLMWVGDKHDRQVLPGNDSMVAMAKRLGSWPVVIKK